MVLSLHQPTSRVYRSLDKVLALTHGGHLLYCGPPMEAVSSVMQHVGMCSPTDNADPVPSSPHATARNPSVIVEVWVGRGVFCPLVRRCSAQAGGPVSLSVVHAESASSHLFIAPTSCSCLVQRRGTSSSSDEGVLLDQSPLLPSRPGADNALSSASAPAASRASVRTEVLCSQADIPTSPRASSTALGTGSGGDAATSRGGASPRKRTPPASCPGEGDGAAGMAVSGNGSGHAGISAGADFAVCGESKPSETARGTVAEAGVAVGIEMTSVGVRRRRGTQPTSGPEVSMYVEDRMLNPAEVLLAVASTHGDAARSGLAAWFKSSDRWHSTAARLREVTQELPVGHLGTAWGSGLGPVDAVLHSVAQFSLLCGRGAKIMFRDPGLLLTQVGDSPTSHFVARCFLTAFCLLLWLLGPGHRRSSVGCCRLLSRAWQLSSSVPCFATWSSI